MSRAGSQEPTFHYAEKYEKSEGEYAALLSASYDLRPHPWQRAVLNDWLAVDVNGKLVHSYCVLEVPRQNGKTGVSDPRETWGLIKRGEHILHTAQEFQTAKKAFDRLRKKFGTRKNDPFAEYPELNALVDHYTTSAGQMVLDLTNGAHIEFRTRGNNSDMGRGGTFDLVVIDEAQAYTEEQDASLAPLNSAAPSGSPQTILMGTPPLPTANNKGIIFSRAIEGFHDTPMAGSCIHEWSVTDIGNVADKKRWYDTNPSLGYQLLEEALEKDLRTMSEDSFAREHLGFLAKKHELLNYAIPANLWEACKSSEPKPEAVKTAYGVKFSADGSMVCLCGAVVDENDHSRIALIDQQPTGRGIQWLADWLNERVKVGCCVVIDGRNGVDLLIDRIRDTWKYKDSIIKPSAHTMVAAASLLVAELGEQTLTWYIGQEALNQSAISSVKRPISGGWGFGGDDSIAIEG
ncbi:MAG: hypothetical protein U0L09_08995, partial [Christensenellales bacterium]|nr:hypothetical protein [Christensenellales bacterium]